MQSEMHGLITRATKMTNLPPSLPYESSPQLQSGSRAPALIAWCVILLCVGLVMVRVQHAYNRAAELGVANPSSEMKVQFVGKSAIGFKAMIGAGATTKGSAPMPAQNQDQMIQSLDQYATTPAEKVRTITVVAELKGPGDALKRIDTLEKSDKAKSSGEVEQDLWALRRIYISGISSLDGASKQRLIDRHGFFGRLATVYGLSDTNFTRSKVLAEARTSAILLTVIGVIVLILLGVVLAAVITAIVLAAVGSIKRLYVPQPWASSAFLEAFAIYLSSFILLGFVMSKLTSDSLAWDWVALALIPLVMAWVKWRGLGASEMRHGFGWYWGRGPLIEIPLGIFGYFAGVPVIVAGFAISMQLMKHAHVSPMHPIQKMLEGNGWHVLNLYGIACVFAPVLEETMFRGALFNHMRRRWNWLISASLVAFIFASIHPQGWTLIPALGSIAIVLAALREWRGAIWAPIAAHATNNFIVLSLALMAAR